MKIIRSFEQTNRYSFDFDLCTTKKGFAQVDTSQDAWYFGTWTNPFELKTVCYCEGDITISQSENADEYAQDLRDIKSWNESQGHEFRGIDPGFNEALENKLRDLGLNDLMYN
jgi:hypothetical protein